MSADGLILNSIFPPWIVLSLSVSILVFFVWKEIQRKGRFLSIRIVAQVVIILSLVALILRPSYKTEKTISSALLLTKGYDKKTADSLVNLYKHRVIRTIDAAAYKQSEILPSWHALYKDAADIRFVIGDGIPAHALDENKDLHFNYIAGDQPQGFTQIKLEPLKSNQKNFIQGEFNSADKNAMLKLTGPGGAEDSVLLKTKGLSAFKLTTKTKQAGKFVYQIQVIEKGKSIQTENLPIEVLPERKLNVLFIQQYPTFESRYIKNYLSEKGHSVALRYQVSKNTFRYEYANREKQIIPRLNSPLLNTFDLLITTPEALQTLSSTEIQALETSAKEGLGILLLFNQATVKNIKNIFPFELVPVKNDTVKLASDQWSEHLTLPAVSARINTSPSIQGLFRDSDNKILSGYFYNGAGKTGFQFLNETYRLALEGKAEEYASLWSPLIDGVARETQNNFKIKITSPFPWYVNHPVHFEVISSSEIPQLKYDTISLALKEDVTVNQLWHGTLWANETGWHQLTLQDSTHLNFYISNESEWTALNQMNQQKINKTYQAQSETNSSQIIIYQPFSPLLFFILFILASGTLWLAAKL